MNSTLKSLVFWMVLVVVAVGVWNFSSKFQAPSKAVPFSEFMIDVEAGKVENVTITGQEIRGIYRAAKGDVPEGDFDDPGELARPVNPGGTSSSCQ